MRRRDRLRGIDVSDLDRSTLRGLMGSEATRVKILRLAGCRALLWARERGSGASYEVSKGVDRPLQARCASAPRCPGDAERDPAWVDPAEEAPAGCPYAFHDRGECLEHRNRQALEAALFTPSEARRTRGLLEALGYEVEEEAVEPALDDRILAAHRAPTPGRQVRVLGGPGGAALVLVRSGRRSRSAARGRVGGRS